MRGVFGLGGLAVFLGCAGLATPPGSPVDLTAMVCDGEADAKDRTAELKQNVQSDPITAFATSALGAPTRCRVEWSTDASEDLYIGHLQYTFADGSVLNRKSMLPVRWLARLKATGALDEAAAKKALEATADFPIDWSRAPSEVTEGGVTVKTWWDPKRDQKVGAELSYRKDELVGVGYHLDR